MRRVLLGLCSVVTLSVASPKLRQARAETCPPGTAPNTGADWWDPSESQWVCVVDGVHTDCTVCLPAS